MAEVDESIGGSLERRRSEASESNDWGLAGGQ